MALGSSTVRGAVGSGSDAFEAAFRGFFAAFAVLRLAVAVFVTFLPFVFFLAITPS